MADQVVIFGLGQEEYAMPIEVIREITRLGDVRPIPQAPDYVQGLINLRGQAIPLIDLHNRFGIITDLNFDKDDNPEEGKINEFALITEVEGKSIGFAVDKVREVRVLENIVPPPPLVTSQFIGGIVNLPDRIIMMLIPEKILENDEFNKIQELV